MTSRRKALSPKAISVGGSTESLVTVVVLLPCEPQDQEPINPPQRLQRWGIRKMHIKRLSRLLEKPIYSRSRLLKGPDCPRPELKPAPAPQRPELISWATLVCAVDLDNFSGLALRIYTDPSLKATILIPLNFWAKIPLIGPGAGQQPLRTHSRQREGRVHFPISSSNQISLK